MFLNQQNNLKVIAIRTRYHVTLCGIVTRRVTLFATRTRYLKLIKYCDRVTIFGCMNMVGAIFSSELALWSLSSQGQVVMRVLYSHFTYTVKTKLVRQFFNCDILEKTFNIAKEAHSSTNKNVRKLDKSGNQECLTLLMF